MTPGVLYLEKEVSRREERARARKRNNHLGRQREDCSKLWDRSKECKKQGRAWPGGSEQGLESVLQTQNFVMVVDARHPGRRQDLRKIIYRAKLEKDVGRKE